MLISTLILLVQIFVGLLAIVVCIAAIAIMIYYGLSLAEWTVNSIDDLRERYKKWKQKRGAPEHGHQHMMKWLEEGKQICIHCGYIVQTGKPTINGEPK